MGLWLVVVAKFCAMNYVNKFGKILRTFLFFEYLQPGTYDCSNHASLMMQEQQATFVHANRAHANVLAYTGKLKNFYFFGASDARWVNLQRLYTLAKMLRVFYQRGECFISIASVLSALWVFYHYCGCFISVVSILSKNRLFEFSSTNIYQISIVCTPFNWDINPK